MTLKGSTKKLHEKLMESLSAVLPIIGIVLLLSFTVAPISPSILLCFLMGAVLIIVGMMFFTLGAEMAMSPMGERIGTAMTKSRKLWLVILLSFLLGFIITISEPDLQVLAQQVPSVPNMILILAVAAGVGVFLVMAFLRMLFSISLPRMLLIFYAVVFILAMFVPKSFLSIAFDSGGVTTGPMTVPFIMALGVGVASIRSDENAKSDSFGLVALCSIGPILSVLILGFVYDNSGSTASEILVSDFETTREIGAEYIAQLPTYLAEVAVALLPIFAFFLLFQFFALRIKKRPFQRILVGIALTYVGLVLFLTGVNVGFSSLGYVLGGALADGWTKYLLIPLAMLMGWFIINAEPAVHVLNKQVEELSAGAISAKAMGLSLSIAVSAANGLAMLRVLTGIPILYFMVPGYIIALVMAFFVPPTFTAIAFDSGGVASGPLTATFMLPFAMGASVAVGGNVMTDAFGLVAMVAMMPLITVQIMGVIYVVKSRRSTAGETLMEQYADDDVIELWEVA